MNRNQKSVYCFIYDENKHFYRATQSANGSWSISHNAQLYPIRHNPKNLRDSPVEFATNKSYFSMNRSINYPLEFTLDGAAILHYKYVNGKGINENMYFAMFEFDSEDGKYKLSYNGKFDFEQKKRDEKISNFTVSVIDDSGWGVLSQNDDVEFALDCSENNPKAIKVLFDDFTLNNRYTYQTVAAPIQRIGPEGLFIVPFVLVNQDGDSFGLVAKSQTYGSFLGLMLNNPNLQTSLGEFLYTFYDVNGVNIVGNIRFTWNSLNPLSAVLYIFINTSAGQVFNIFKAGFGTGSPGLIVGQTYDIPFNINIDLVSGEKVFLLAELQDSPANHFSITPVVTNVFVSTKTKADTTICYGLRPLDALQDIVRKSTFERYSINSDFFTINNKSVLIPGDNFRGVRDGKIYTSFKDFFDSFSALFFMALRVVNGSLFMELADEVYKQGTNIIDLGELIECETEPATEYYGNELEAGIPKQDYRHASGRLEYNCLDTWSLPFLNVKNKISFVSKYRTDCFGMIFLILDYKGSSTKDNSGDKSVFIVDITDETGTAAEEVETFENINVNNAPLAPIIKYPLDGDIIHNNKPFLKGIGIPGTNVNIYIGAVLDGGTVVDGSGNWTYQIIAALPSYNPGVFSGISTINATNTTMLGALDTIQLTIDTTIVSPTGIIYPRVSDNLYNNLPLIRGVAPAGTNIDIFLDTVLLASVVTDNSCKFEYKVVVPILNGVHSLDIGGAPINFNVNSFVALPLITYIGSELDGFILVNNLPLIRGVAIPGTVVRLFLNYITYADLGNAVADANGNWSFQVVPVFYIDPLSGLPVDLAPIRNGLNVVSTLLINNSVQINVSGFKLNRPIYDSITGVPDNTVFNTRFRPELMVLNHKSLLSSVMDKQRGDLIEYQTSDKNPNLRTVLGSEVLAERDNIPYSSLGNPIAILEYAKVKCVARESFSKTLYNFNNGGTVKGRFKGSDIYMLPIGSMKMKSIMDDVQDWRLLISPLTSYSTLLNLSKDGLTINLMTNAIYHSDHNTLHFVEYGKVFSDKYNFKDLYSDWFDSRNDAWIDGKTNYIQKLQKTEVITDQVITNGISALTLRMYRCKDAKLIDTKNYDAVAPSPIPIPEIVLEAKFTLANYPEDQYFFVMYVGSTPVAISERIETRIKWKRTILLESFASLNKPGVFYSTGFKTIIRVEGLIKKIQPDIDTVVANEESGDSEMIFSTISKKRMVRCGNAKGFPDYLAIKVAAALVNDNCSIEGENYTLADGEKINPSDDVDGIPMYYYQAVMKFKENAMGKVFAGTPDGGVSSQGVVLTVDASAIGLPTDVIINISEV